MRTILILTLVPFLLVIVLVGFLLTNPECQFQIGQAFMRGDGLPKNQEWGNFWLRQAADHGQVEAQTYLGRSYLVGLPNQDLKESVKYLTMGEKQNNNECIKLLSYAYCYGQGVPQDYNKSMDLSTRSIKIENDGRELMNLSFLTLILPAPLRNYSKSRQYATELSRVGYSSAWAYWTLGVIYEYGLDSPKDFGKAAKFYGRGAVLGDNDCEYALVRMTMEGKTPPSQSLGSKSLTSQNSKFDKHLNHVDEKANRNAEEATQNPATDSSIQDLAIMDPTNQRRYLENASNTQVLDAQMLYALVLASESRDANTDKKYDKLLEQLTKRGFVSYAARLKTVSPPGKRTDPAHAAQLLRDESNDTDGSKLLVSALCKRFGIGGKPDFNAFFETLNKAVSKDLVDAITVKANLLTGMEKGDPDYEMAGRLYRTASEEGHIYAQGQFGMLNALGFGIKHDWTPAISWLEKSSNAGDPESQFMLGGFFCDGRGVLPDRKKALALFEKAAKQGHEDAALELGIISGSSEFPDLDQDLDKAEYWLREAADSGFQEANYYLGTMFNNSRKTPEAVRCFKEAANKGHLLSQLQLAKLYISQDNLKEARKLFEAAQKQGNDSAARELKRLDIRAAMLGNNREAPLLVVAKSKIEKGTVIREDMLGTTENKTEEDADWRNEVLTDVKPAIGSTAIQDFDPGEYIGGTEIDFPSKERKSGD